MSTTPAPLFNSLLLDQTAWDLVLDANGNIALAQPPYAVAQDVACAQRTFLGEVYYDDSQGIPYFEDVLGQFPPVSLITGLLEAAALTVSGVVSATTTIQSFDSDEQTVSGQTVFTDNQGTTTTVNF
jgi:hypothetical protein